MRSRGSRKGFTLIEILIVITIIAVVASLILAGLTVARKTTYKAITKTTISNLDNALKQYVRDTGKYPGREYPDHENGFPALFEALFGRKPPKVSGEYRRKQELDIVEGKSVRIDGITTYGPQEEVTDVEKIPTPEDVDLAHVPSTVDDIRVILQAFRNARRPVSLIGQAASGKTITRSIHSHFGSERAWPFGVRATSMMK